jgi:hypothetical protein
VPHWNEKVRVTVGNLGLELPSALVKTQDTAIDSASAVFEGSGLTVIVDQGPFADRLDGYVGNPGYREEMRNMAGATARTIFFQRPDRGTYTMAVHFTAPKLVTVVIHADKSVPEQVPKEILESLRLPD